MLNFEPGWTDEWVRENAARLRDLRLERRISRNQLADEAGVSLSQIVRVEAGQDARISTFLKIYNGLGYRISFELQEICEEAAGLLSEEADRRADRRHDGLISGKRWR